MQHAATILDNIVETLRTMDELAWVSAGQEANDGLAPNACVIVEAMDSVSPAGRLGHRQLELCIEIRTSADNKIAARARAMDLAELVVDKLLEDPTRPRDGLCEDLPAGDATTIRRIRLDETTAKIEVLCRFDASSDACELLLDGESLFSSGPARLEISSWVHQTLRRSFPGLDGELVMPLGRRSRTLAQCGTLTAPTRELLETRINAISTRLDGQLHQLTEDALIYSNLLLEQFAPGAFLQTASQFSCDYRVDYRELAS